MTAADNGENGSKIRSSDDDGKPININLRKPSTALLHPMTRPLLATIRLLLLFSFAGALSLPRERRDFLFATSSSFATSALGVTSTSLLAPGPQEARALSSVEAEARYDEYAASYDVLDGGDLSRALGIDAARQRTTSRASGYVLEVGVGTGLNLQYYDPTKLSSLTLVDVSDGMLLQAKARAAGLDNLRGIPVSAHKADATIDLVRLFGENRFDTVVDTFSLCVMGEVGAKMCLAQMGRVVKAGGRVLLLENARSSNQLLGMYQDATAEAAAGAGGKGCVYNQNVSELIRASGRLEIELEEQFAAGLFRSFVCKPRIGA